MRVEEFILVLLDTSGLAFYFLLSVSILVGGNGNGTDELHGANVRVVDRITVEIKNSTRPSLKWIQRCLDTQPVRSPPGTPTYSLAAHHECLLPELA